VSAMGEEELGGVRVHVELEIRGYDLEVVVNEVFEEEGDTGLIIYIAAPSYSWMHSWHRAIGSRGVRLLVVFMVKDEVESWDGWVVGDF